MNKFYITLLTLVATPAWAVESTGVLEVTPAPAPQVTLTSAKPINTLQPKVYMGAIYAKLNTNLDVNTTFIYPAQQDQTGYGAILGLSLTPNWALEAQYLQSKKNDSNVRIGTRILNQYQFNRTGAYVVYTYPFKQVPFFINAKLGYNQKTGAKAQFSNDDVAVTENISALSYGFGLGVKLKQVDVGLNYLSYTRNKTDSGTSLALDDGSTTITRLTIADSQIKGESATLLSVTYHF